MDGTPVYSGIEIFDYNIYAWVGEAISCFWNGPTKDIIMCYKKQSPAINTIQEHKTTSKTSEVTFKKVN